MGDHGDVYLLMTLCHMQPFKSLPVDGFRRLIRLPYCKLLHLLAYVPYHVCPAKPL